MEEKFLDKVKNGAVTFFKGVKSFFVKTARVNSSNNYGCIENIGDLIVYNDYALISAVGMDDVKFTSENVVSYTFNGLGRIRSKKATVSYKIVLDDNVVFPEKVREKNDVNNLTATIFVKKDTLYYLGNGRVGKAGTSQLNECEVYGYENCFVLAINFTKMVGEKQETYQESALYPYSDIIAMEEKEGKKFVVNFDNEKYITFVPKDAVAYENTKKIKEKANK